MYFVIKKHFAAVMSRTTTPLTAIEPSLTEHEFLQPVQTQKTLVLIQQESFSTHNLTIEPINNSVTAYLVRVYISPTWTCSPLPRDKATKTLKTEKKTRPPSSHDGAASEKRITIATGLHPTLHHNPPHRTPIAIDLLEKQNLHSEYEHNRKEGDNFMTNIVRTTKQLVRMPSMNRCPPLSPHALEHLEFTKSCYFQSTPTIKPSTAKPTVPQHGKTTLD